MRKVKRLSSGKEVFLVKREGEVNEKSGAWIPIPRIWGACVDARNRLGPQAVTVGRKWSCEKKAERCGG